MRITIVLITVLLLGCSSLNPMQPSIESPLSASHLAPASSDAGRQTGWEVEWGFCQLTIARDGSHAELVPNRSLALYTWGHHINALKLLEGSPCTNCVSVSNVHLLSDGNVSVDISITHPFANPVYTGFDVRGIIMFPASQRVPDDDIREQAGMGPYDGGMKIWFSSSKKGDAELVNREGRTKFWNPITDSGVWTETGYPIFEYYHGKYASGENIGTLNPFIRFHSNETRHMFEVGKTVTRTYIIKPPAQGPIEACYAVYAHWAEPDVTPVTNPATDFPLIANSCLPYELEFHQDGLIDPDAPLDVQAEHIHIHMKHWGVIPLESDTGVEYWDSSYVDFTGDAYSADFEPHPSGEPDEYWPTEFRAFGYYKIPDAFPGTWPIMFNVSIRDPIKPNGLGVVGRENWIMDVQFGALDGQW